MSDLSAAAGSSFYWPMRLLAADRRAALGTIYRWCRLVDGLVDRGGDPSPAAAAVMGWRHWLQTSAATRLSPDEATLARRLDAVLAAHDIPRAHPAALLDGLMLDLAGEMRAPAMSTLTAYCARVAGIPGRMCLAVLGWRGAEADAFADAAGIAVQLTNILRDVAEDAALDRLYIPREALLSAGISATDPRIAIGDRRFSKAWFAVLLLAEARFVHAETLLPRERARNVRPALAMLAIYRSLLAQLKRTGWRPQAPRLRLPAWRKLAIAARVMAFGR